jgi:fluoride ion exporter CrcB/FEX
MISLSLGVLMIIGCYMIGFGGFMLIRKLIEISLNIKGEMWIPFVHVGFCAVGTTLVIFTLRTLSSL